jgi:hypothetical protein
MPQITTTEQTVAFWAAEAAKFDQLLADLDNLLPTTHRGEVPFTEATRNDVEEALERARLAADTVLGSYTRVLHQERANPQQPTSPYSQNPQQRGY